MTVKEGYGKKQRFCLRLRISPGNTSANYQRRIGKSGPIAGMAKTSGSCRLPCACRGEHGWANCLTSGISKCRLRYDSHKQKCLLRRSLQVGVDDGDGEVPLGKMAANEQRARNRS